MEYLSPKAARRFYDLVGRREDSQAFYEDPALDILVRKGQFGSANSIFEFGCGTGRLAERLLDDFLPPSATYTACDISPKMVELTRRRLDRFGARVTIFESQGDTRSCFGKASFDRIVTSYVLDLLPPGEITEFLGAAATAVMPGGFVCAASIASGKTVPASVVSGIWKAVNRVSPILTGGCRPIALQQMFAPERWSVLHASHVVAWGVTSAVVIASPR